MGYRSNVRLSTTKKGWNAICQYLEKCGQKKNVLDSTDFIYDNEKVVYVGWDDVKWYENDMDDYPYVQETMNGIKTLRENNIPYVYHRIGEDLGDIEDEDFDYNGELYEIAPYIDTTFEEDFIFKYFKKKPILTEQDLRTAYEKYCLQWMLDYGYSLNDIINGMEDVVSNEIADAGMLRVESKWFITEVYDRWLEEDAFGGKCFACYEEWLNNEGKQLKEKLDKQLD